MKIEKYLIIIMFFEFLFQTGNEVNITLLNKPVGNINVVASTDGTVYDIDFLPTDFYDGGIINTSFNIIRYDFITTPNSTEIVFGYGKYKIEIDGNYVYIDM